MMYYHSYYEDEMICLSLQLHPGLLKKVTTLDKPNVSHPPWERTNRLPNFWTGKTGCYQDAEKPTPYKDLMLRTWKNQLPKPSWLIFCPAALYVFGYSKKTRGISKLMALQRLSFLLHLIVQKNASFHVGNIMFNRFDNNIAKSERLVFSNKSLQISKHALQSFHLTPQPQPRNTLFDPQPTPLVQHCFHQAASDKRVKRSRAKVHRLLLSHALMAVLKLILTEKQRHKKRWNPSMFAKQHRDKNN